MSHMHSRTLSFVAAAAIVALAACSAKKGTGVDSTKATHAPARDSANIIGMGGSTSMTGDADHDFLRMMSDHHKGLILMVHKTVDSKEKLGVKAVASRMDKEQDAEMDTMMTMLEKDYKDPYAPTIIPEHQAMADELNGKSGAAYDRTFLTNVVKHHQEAITMIDDYLPKAKNQKVKQMAERMKATQSKEITELRAKLASKNP